MSEKIEWYKEVLELEPNSKVFLPLARLLVEENKVFDAINILQDGLRRHPEFLEARLFLVELLYRYNMQEECSEEINLLAGMFKKYAGFWQAWAACLANSPKDDDTASVMRFLAVTFMHGPLSFHEILNRGLATYLPHTQTVDATTGLVWPEKAIIENPDEKIETDKFHNDKDIYEKSEAPSTSINVLGEQTDCGEDKETHISGDGHNLEIPPEDNENISEKHFSSLQSSNNIMPISEDINQEEEYSNLEPPFVPTEEDNATNEIRAALNTLEENANPVTPTDKNESCVTVMAKNSGECEKEENLSREKRDHLQADKIESKNVDLENVKGLGGESFKELFEDNAEIHPSFNSDFSSATENMSPDAMLESSFNNEARELITNKEHQSLANHETLDNDNFEIKTSSEPYTIRTRSMADVLADQEDYRGALEIYRELLNSSNDPIQREELLEKIEAISRKLEEAEALSTNNPDSLSQMISSKSKDKLISMLETLARRVEARSRG